MNSKIIKLGIIGRTNAGKSTLINSLIGETISIENKKVNTTVVSIRGILNVKNTQLIFYDTPGMNFLKSKELFQKKIRTELWDSVNHVDLILYIIDSNRYNFNIIQNDITKINEIKKPIIFLFNKIDLVDQKKIFKYIEEIDKFNIVTDFFNISAKNKTNLNLLVNFLISKAKFGNKIFNQDEITDKDDIFISNECTRNSILKFLHKEIPYNINIKNITYKILNKNNIKIKQSIEISNKRYKPIILGKKGELIKKIREYSQSEIEKILNSKIHLYLNIDIINDK